MCGEQFLKIKYHFFFFVLLLWIGGQEMVHNLYKFNHHAGCRFGKNEAKNKLNPHIKTMPVTVGADEAVYVRLLFTYAHRISIQLEGKRGGAALLPSN